MNAYVLGCELHDSFSIHSSAHFFHVGFRIVIWNHRVKVILNLKQCVHHRGNFSSGGRSNFCQFVFTWKRAFRNFRKNGLRHKIFFSRFPFNFLVLSAKVNPATDFHKFGLFSVLVPTTFETITLISNSKHLSLAF